MAQYLPASARDRGDMDLIPELISFRMYWLDLLEVQGTQESSPTPQFKGINFSALSLLHSPTLTSICDYWKNHSFD